MKRKSEGTPITLRQISKSFGSVTVLHDIALDVYEGEFLTLLGPSGCGKSTLLNVIAGYERADTGTVRLGDTDVSRLPARKRGVGIVFQSYSLFPHLTVRANIEFGLKVARRPKAHRAARSAELLDIIGLAAHASKFPHELSGGQQQRVALARALATNPRVLLLDEPLSALDAIVRVRLREEIRRIQREAGITTILVTHDQEEALSIADRVVVMSDGRFEQIDTPERVYSNPRTPFVADFIGTVNRLQTDPAAVRPVIFGTPLDVPVHADERTGRAVALIRPEQLTLLPAPEGLGVIESLTLRGPLTTALVRHADHQEPVRVDMRTGERPGMAVGDRVSVAVLSSSDPQPEHEVEFA